MTSAEDDPRGRISALVQLQSGGKTAALQGNPSVVNNSK
jgi:hypothetical protein